MIQLSRTIRRILIRAVKMTISPIPPSARTKLGQIQKQVSHLYPHLINWKYSDALMSKLRVFGSIYAASAEYLWYSIKSKLVTACFITICSFRICVEVALERDPRFKKLNTNIGATASEMTYSNDVTLDNQQAKAKKMPPTQTFFAIVKAYCAINVLLLPMSFGEGGYILAPIAMLIALFFQGLSAAQLTSLARKYSIYSYPLIMQRAHGNVGLYVARVCISLAHL